jgi:hypothetical protein
VLDMINFVYRWMCIPVQVAAEREVTETHVCVVRALTSLGILQMIKLFGWEPKLSARLAEKRELQYIMHQVAFELD